MQQLNNIESTATHSYKLYPGKEQPLSSLAVLNMGDVPLATIDGLRVSSTDYQEVQLLPGQHKLSWRKGFGFSVLVEPTMQKAADSSVTVDLLAGHRYRLFAERTHGQGYQFYFWVEDAIDNKVIAGEKRP